MNKSVLNLNTAGFPRVSLKGLTCFWLGIFPIVWGISSCAPADNSLVYEASTTIPIQIPPPLIEATLAGEVDRVRSLLGTGTDPNGVYNTNTALTYAARDGFTDIARLLVEAGAEVNWIDGEGVTPLILAAFKGHVEIAELLLDHGADTTVRDQWNRTAMDYALRRGDDDAIVLLLQRTQRL